MRPLRFARALDLRSARLPCVSAVALTTAHLYGFEATSQWLKRRTLDPYLVAVRSDPIDGKMLITFVQRGTRSRQVVSGIPLRVNAGCGTNAQSGDNANGEPAVAARFENDDVWLTQKHLALLYKTTKQNVSQHIQSIFDSGELNESSCVKKFFTVEEKFGRPAKIPVYHYNLDLIIALGYRIDSPVAIKFRS